VKPGVNREGIQFRVGGGVAKGHHDGAWSWKLCCFPSLIFEMSSSVDIVMDILSYPSSIAHMELPHFGQNPRRVLSEEL